MNKEELWKLRTAYQEMIKSVHGRYDESYIKELEERKPQKTISKWF